MESAAYRISETRNSINSSVLEARAYPWFNNKLSYRRDKPHNCYKLDFLDYIFVSDDVQLPSKTAILRDSETMGNYGHWTVQGHSRSPILAPIESPCAIS